MSAATVYAERLARFKHGHPLWIPEPLEGLDGRIRGVRLGDVGYVNDYGGFKRLFNITVDATDELNAGGVPDGFIPIDFNEKALRHQKEGFLEPGTICSEGVERCEMEASVTG